VAAKLLERATSGERTLKGFSDAAITIGETLGKRSDMT
jgi:hypothetical protein